MKKKLAAAVLGLVIANSAFAVDKPVPMLSDPRIMTVNYSEDNVVPIQAAPYITTQVVFGGDETILNANSGDQSAWQISVPPNLPNMLFIKPSTQSVTNLTVITNKHTYYFNISVSSTNKNPVFAVHFNYPDDQVAAQNFIKQQQAAILSPGSKPGDYNWDYTFNGDKGASNYLTQLLIM